MSDIWTQAADGGNEQVKRELLAEAERIELFIKLATEGKIKFPSESETVEADPFFDISEEEEAYLLIDQLSHALYILDGEYPFPNWVMDWYLKANAWKAAGYIPPEDES